MPLSHAQIWQALDGLAAELSLTPSALAKRAGLDPTSFNRSKRESADTPPRPRWPSTESLAKVLEATGRSLADFAALADGSTARPGVPLIGMAQAGRGGFFDDAGLPVGEGWDLIDFPMPREGVFALEVSGDSMLPLYRPGDRIVVDRRAQDVRRGDRLALRTHAGEVMVKELGRATARRLELRSINPDFPDPVVERRDIDWMARVVLALH